MRQNADSRFHVRGGTDQFKSPLAHARSGEVVRSHRFIFAASQTNDPDGLAMLLTPFSSAAETTALDWGESGSGLFVIEKS